MTEDMLKQILSELAEFKAATEKKIEVLEIQSYNNTQLLKSIELKLDWLDAKIDGISEHLEEIDILISKHLQPKIW